MIPSERPSAQSGTADYGVRATPAEDRTAHFELAEYLLHKLVSRCIACGRTHVSSNLFEVHIHPPTGARRLLPASSLRSDIPVGVATLKPRLQPLCHECITAAPAAAPPTFHDSEEAWRQTLLRKQEVAQAAKAAAKRPPPLRTEVSLNDL